MQRDKIFNYFASFQHISNSGTYQNSNSVKGQMGTFYLKKMKRHWHVHEQLKMLLRKQICVATETRSKHTNASEVGALSNSFNAFRTIEHSWVSPPPSTNAIENHTFTPGPSAILRRCLHLKQKAVARHKISLTELEADGKRAR